VSPDSAATSSIPAAPVLSEDGSRLTEVWRQSEIPVVVRGGPVRPLVVKFPNSWDDYAWLRNERRREPEWLPRQRAWSIPKTWFEHTLHRLLARFNAVYVIQPLNRLEKCAPACWNATGAKCECSCMGANHGSKNIAGRWHVVSDTFAARIRAREFSCRLLHRPS
jgi:hypothetical protein